MIFFSRRRNIHRLLMQDEAAFPLNLKPFTSFEVLLRLKHDSSV